MKKKYEYVHYVFVSTTKKPTSLVVTLKNILNLKVQLSKGMTWQLPAEAPSGRSRRRRRRRRRLWWCQNRAYAPSCPPTP